jgi:hypothetical protein
MIQNINKKRRIYCDPTIPDKYLKQYISCSGGHQVYIKKISSKSNTWQFSNKNLCFKIKHSKSGISLRRKLKILKKVLR